MKLVATLAILTALAGGAGCNRSEMEALRQANRDLASENTRLTERISVLSETEQNAWTKAVDALDAVEASQEDVHETAPAFREAERLLARFIEHYPKSSYIDQATQKLKDAHDEGAEDDAVAAAIDAFEKSLQERDFKRAAVLLRQMPGHLSDESVAGLKQELDEAKNKPMDLSVRELLGNAERYIGKRVRIGPVSVAMNLVSGRSLEVCESKDGSLLGYDTDACFHLLYDRTSDSGRWRDLSSDSHPKVVVTGHLIEWAPPMFEARSIELQ